MGTQLVHNREPIVQFIRRALKHLESESTILPRPSYLPLQPNLMPLALKHTGILILTPPDPSLLIHLRPSIQQDIQIRIRDDLIIRRTDDIDLLALKLE